MIKKCYFFLFLFSSACATPSLLETLHQKTRIAKLMRESALTNEQEINQLFAALQSIDQPWVESKNKEFNEILHNKNAQTALASVQTRTYQEVQDYIQFLMQCADEAQKNFSAFAARYGFVKGDGSIDTQAILEALKTIEQEITNKIGAMAEKKDELLQQMTMQITSIKSSIDRYIKTITPVKQLLTSPLDQILTKFAAMSSSTQPVEVLAKEQGFTNPDGTIKTTAFLDALTKMEKEALEFATKISEQKKAEVQKTVDPQLANLRKKIEEYKKAHPEKEPQTPTREPAPAATTTEASTPTPSAPSTETAATAAETPTEQTPTPEEKSESAPSPVESEPSLQPMETPPI